MDAYLWMKYAHILGATVLFGTGMGTAFQMVMAHRTGHAASIAVVARNTVLADWVFTTPAVILQPLTGTALAVWMGYGLHESWLIASIVLNGLTSLCWLPVVWIQHRMQVLSAAAVAAGTPLPPAYYRLFRWWFALGWPAFGSVLVIFHLMIGKPSF